MKVSREQMMEHRAHILDAAARLFRERGFENVSVVEVMKAAGLTHGGFYGHFVSKDALIEQAMAHTLRPAPRGDAKPATPARYADAYLSAKHRDNRGASCAYSCVGTEAARGSPELRKNLTGAVRRQIERFTTASPGATEAERRRAAITAWSAMVGAMVLARIVDDEELSDELLAETRASIELG